jgi:hypothetical protein
MYSLSSFILSDILSEKSIINFPPAPTHSDQESNLIGSVIVLLQKPVIAEHIVKASINFIMMA